MVPNKPVRLECFQSDMPISGSFADRKNTPYGGQVVSW